MIAIRADQVRTEVGRAVSETRTTRGIGLLGDYRLGRRLDDGGTNEVYEAAAPGTAGRVVVKFLRRAVAAGAQATEACRNERALVGRLHHPNIAALLALGTTPDGIPYVVREHFESGTLADHLEGHNRINPRAAAALVKRIAVPLAAAHQAGLFHGELRPNKVFLTEAVGYHGPWVKIVDFGLWRLAGDRRGPGARAESIRFTAPELITGDRGVDGLADQFALAAIAYRLFAGVDAFPGDDVAAVLRSVLEDSPASLSAAAGCDPMVGAVIRRGLSKEPRDRFPSVLEFAAALEAVVPRSHESAVDDPDASTWIDAVPAGEGAQPIQDLEETSLSLLRLGSAEGNAAWQVETPPPRRGYPRQVTARRWPRALLAGALLSALAALAWWADLPGLDWSPSAIWRDVVLLSGR